MAIKEWHPGKLVLLWAVLALWWIFLKPNLDRELEGFGTVVGVLGFVWVFSVSWRWFTARQRPRDG